MVPETSRTEAPAPYTFSGQNHSRPTKRPQHDHGNMPAMITGIYSSGVRTWYVRSSVFSTRRHPAHPVSVPILHPRGIQARSINGVSGRIFQGSRCSLLWGRKHFLVRSWYWRRPNPTRTITLTPTRTQNGLESGQKRGGAGFDFLFNILNCGPRFASQY